MNKTKINKTKLQRELIRLDIQIAKWFQVKDKCPIYANLANKRIEILEEMKSLNQIIESGSFLKKHWDIRDIHHEHSNGITFTFRMIKYNVYLKERLNYLQCYGELDTLFYDIMQRHRIIYMIKIEIETSESFFNKHRKPLLDLL